MSEPRLNVLCVVGTSAASSATHVVIKSIAQSLRALGDDVDVFDPNEESLPLFNPQSSYSLPGFVNLKERVERADAYVFGTPDYHGSVSSTLKNFLDHFWQEFAGKLFATVVASYDKGLTVTDHLRTVARQCYAWSMPYGVSFNEREDLKDGVVASEALKKRLDMMVNDVWNYGRVIAEQRLRDLNGNEPGFLARYRAKR